MTNFDKVVKALECKKEYSSCDHPCKLSGACHYARWTTDSAGIAYLPYVCDTKQIYADALAIIQEQQEKLTAQQPGLIPLDELLSSPQAQYELIWLERKSGNISPHRYYSYGKTSPYVHFQCFGECDFVLPINEYGKSWRCWEYRPSQGERAKMAWE